MLESLEQRLCLSALSFLPPVLYPGTTNSGSKVAIGDFNNDGKPDLAVSSFTSVFISLNKGGGTFAGPTGTDLNAIADAIAVGDFNHDGFNDVAVDLEYGAVRILLGKGDGTFADNTLSADDGGKSLHHSIAVADFNADGWPDLAVTSADTSVLSVSINQHNGSFSNAHYNAGIDPTSVVFDDYDRDHGWDLAVTSAGARGSGVVSVLLDNTIPDPADPQSFIPDGTFGPATPYPVGVGPIAAAAGFPDFNSDGFDDLAVSNAFSGTVSVLTGDGGGGFNPAKSIPIDANPTAIAVSDFTGSGHTDMAVLVGSNVEIALGNGNGTFQPPVTFPIGGDNQSSIAIADLNGDGKPDIVTTLDPLVSVLLAGTPPTGSISGSVFNDANANGALDAGEKGLPNVRVYLDANKNGIFDSGTETGALTNASGNYTFTKLPSDTYTIREELPAGERMTLPTLGSYNVTLAANQVVKKSFGNTTHPLLKGTIFNDANSDGLNQPTEKGLAGWTVFIDTNKNGLLDSGEPRTTSDASGNYAFRTLSAGAYRVREVLKSGFRRTSPAAGYYDVTLAAAGVTAGKSFGDTSNVLISGTVFNDANGDKLRDKNHNVLEAGLANWRVYIDANNNGIFDKGELSTLSDASGNWAFATLHARSAAYVIRVVSQAGWTRTTPTGGKPPGGFSVTLNAAGILETSLLFGERHA